MELSLLPSCGKWGHSRLSPVSALSDGLKKVLFIGKRISFVRCRGKQNVARASILSEFEDLSVAKFVGAQNREIFAFVNLPKKEHVPPSSICLTWKVDPSAITNDTTGRHLHRASDLVCDQG
jgi:hypothetical protein